MGSPINKILASTAQSFSEAEQAQARANIGAMAATATGLSATVEHDSNLSGSGTSASPLGLNTSCTWTISTSGTRVRAGEITLSSHNNTSYFGVGFASLSNPIFGASSTWDGSRLQFNDASGQSERVDLSSIQRWNSYSSLTGALSVSTNAPNVTGDGTTSSPVGLGSSIIFESGDSANSLGRRGMTVSTDTRTAWYYGAFASFEKADATANYYADHAQFQSGYLDEQVNAQSIYSWNHPQYFCIIKHPPANTTQLVTVESYPTGLTADARLDIINFGATSAGYNYVVYEADTFHGRTATLTAGESATIWWDNTDHIWTNRGKYNP